MKDNEHIPVSADSLPVPGEHHIWNFRKERKGKIQPTTLEEVRRELEEEENLDGRR